MHLAHKTGGGQAFGCALTILAASCTMNWVRALSSAVRAFGLHPKGRPFKSDSAHHCDAMPFSRDVVQLVRTLPCRWLESYTVTARSPKIPDVSTIVFMHLHESSFLFRAISPSPNLHRSLYMRIAVATDPRLRTSRSQDPMVDRFAAPVPI